VDKNPKKRKLENNPIPLKKSGPTYPNEDKISRRMWKTL